MIFRKISFGFVVVWLICLATSVSFAFSVAPATIEDFRVLRGQVATTVLHLLGSIVGETVKVYVTDFTIDRKGAISFEQRKDWKYSASSWIRLYRVWTEEAHVGEIQKGLKVVRSALYDPTETLTLLKDEPTYIGVAVKAPWDARPGQYYACIMIEPAEFRSLESELTTFEVMSRVAIPVIIEVPGIVPKIGGKVVSAEVKIEKEGIKILATFENTGNVLEEVTGKARVIQKETGRVCDVVALKALGSPPPGYIGKIYPESLRDFQGEVGRPLPPGDYEVTVNFDYGHKVRKARIKTSFVVSQTVATAQREILLLNAKPQLIEFKLIPGGYHVKTVKVENMDLVKSLKVIAQSNADWLEVLPQQLHLASGQAKTIKVIVKIPRKVKLVNRVGRILLQADKGKLVPIDVVVKDARES